MKAWLAARTVKELLALIALIASIVGAGLITANRIYLIKLLADAKQWSRIGDIAYLDTLIIGVVLLSFGLAINKRTAKVSKDGVEISGGVD